MAHRNRSAKSGNTWTEEELEAFNIEIKTLDQATFFEPQGLAPPTVDPTILRHAHMPPGEEVTKSTRLFFQYLEDPFTGFDTGPPMDAAFQDFAFFLLGLLKYDEPDRVLHSRIPIEFSMCKRRVHVTSDICLTTDHDYKLLVHIYKTTETSQPEAQLIAEAVAAYHEYSKRRKTEGKSPTPPRIYPGILFTGTTPTFYKIPITDDLLDAIHTGEFPAKQTVVYRMIPPIMDAVKKLTDGMRRLESRRVILECLEAFQQFITDPGS